MLFAATLGQRHALGVAWPVHQTSGWHMLRYGPGCSIGSRSVVVGRCRLYRMQLVSALVLLRSACMAASLGQFVLHCHPAWPARPVIHGRVAVLHAQPCMIVHAPWTIATCCHFGLWRVLRGVCSHDTRQWAGHVWEAAVRLDDQPQVAVLGSLATPVQLCRVRLWGAGACGVQGHSDAGSD